MERLNKISSKDLPQEFSKLVNENFDKLIEHDWYCPKCQSYVSSESVTFEETHQICNTNVIIEEPKRTFTEEEVLAIIDVSCIEGMNIQRTINDFVSIPATRIKEFKKKVLNNYKKNNMENIVLIATILCFIVALYFFKKSKLNQMKQMFCKHTYIPSTKIGYDICIDCRKFKKK